jgi:hypothetical protein
MSGFLHFVSSDRDKRHTVSSRILFQTDGYYDEKLSVLISTEKIDSASFVSLQEKAARIPIT